MVFYRPRHICNHLSVAKPVLSNKQSFNRMQTLFCNRKARHVTITNFVDGIKSPIAMFVSHIRILANMTLNKMCFRQC